MADLTSKYVCPLTQQLINDSVTDPEGNSYERSAIEKWLGDQSISPVVSSIPRGENNDRLKRFDIDLDEESFDFERSSIQ